MPTPSDMRGKTALVTGAAGGLGRATALQLARAGANLCLVDIDDRGLNDAAEQARASGVKVLAHAADLSVAHACTGAVATAARMFGRLDALCNVAGVFIPAHTTAMPASDFEKTLAVNLNAPFYLIQAALPHLLDARGAVVNVTSCAAVIGQAYCAAYCASKAALTHMTRALAMEYIHRHVRFNAVAPGGMLTALAGNMRRLEGPDATLLRRFAPLRGLVDTESVAEMVAFLATDAAHDYHGACISIDKGITVG